MIIKFEMKDESPNDVALAAIKCAFDMGNVYELVSVGYSGCEKNKNFHIEMEVISKY